MDKNYRLSSEELHEFFLQKYGPPNTTGWSPRRRYRVGYYLPGDIYEATIKKIVKNTTCWLDVGGGRALFPNNEKLSNELTERCSKLVAVDPSKNVFENPYAHEKYCCLIEEFNYKETFDLVSFRMVAEHIVDPERVLKNLETLIKPDGIVVIYTINKFCPIPIFTYLTPLSLHYKIKKILWGSEERDTFPVAYRMNSRKDLNRIFTRHDFYEFDFQYLDDLSTTLNFKTLNLLELAFWKIFSSVNIRYPENNLLGFYKRIHQRESIS